MADRFYLPDTPADGQAALRGSEAHHLLHVMRARVGDVVTLFDGTGGEYAATIQQCGRSEVVLATGDREEVSRELPARIVMGVALPKGERQKWLVEKLTELGVARLVPITTERSVAEPKGKSLERLERGVIEACKQCGRNKLMDICAPQNVDDYLKTAGGLKLVAHPTGEPIAPALTDGFNQVSVVVGPEGGLSDREIEVATQHGWTLVNLGSSILRIETAAAALAAIIGNHRQ